MGSVALYGYDGLLYSVGFLVAWLVALLLVAEPLRNTGKYTMADVLSFRMRQRPVRTAAATSTLAVTFFYLLAQMAGAGALVSLLIGIEGKVGQSIVIAVVGFVMIAYVMIGGMKGTTWVQIIKAVLLITAVGITTVWILAMNGFNLSAVLGNAVESHPDGTAILEPMLNYGDSGTSKLGFISLAIALVFGAAGLPHVLMRFYTVPTAKEARRSVVWAIALIGFFYLCTLVLGFAAAYMVGVDVIGDLPGGSNSAAPALAYAVGGTVLMAIISAVAFATILAVVAGLTITASASFAHDIYNGVIKHGEADPKKEVAVARRTAVVIGAVSILGGILAAEQNVAFLVSLAFAIAASANLPSILYSLYWKRFNTRGSLWSIYGGLFSALFLIAFSPVVSGSETAMIPGADFAWFPLTNPATHLGAAGLLPRVAGLGDLLGEQRAQAGRDGGALHDRGRLREGHRRPLRSGADPADTGPTLDRETSAPVTTDPHGGRVLRGGPRGWSAGVVRRGHRGGLRPGAAPTPVAPPGRAGR